MWKSWFVVSSSLHFIDCIALWCVFQRSLSQSDVMDCMPDIELCIPSIANTDSNVCLILIQIRGIWSITYVCVREIYIFMLAVVLYFGMHYSKLTLADHFFSVHIKIQYKTTQLYFTDNFDNSMYNTVRCAHNTIMECESSKNYGQDCKMPWHLLCISLGNLTCWD